MNKYQAFVDMSSTWEENDIDVLSLNIKAQNAKEAMESLRRKIESGEYDDEIKGRKYYIWEITENDLI